MRQSKKIYILQTLFIGILKKKFNPQKRLKFQTVVLPQSWCSLLKALQYLLIGFWNFKLKKNKDWHFILTCHNIGEKLLKSYSYSCVFSSKPFLNLQSDSPHKCWLLRFWSFKFICFWTKVGLLAILRQVHQIATKWHQSLKGQRCSIYIIQLPLDCQFSLALRYPVLS